MGSTDLQGSRQPLPGETDRNRLDRWFCLTIWEMCDDFWWLLCDDFLYWWYLNELWCSSCFLTAVSGDIHQRGWGSSCLWPCSFAVPRQQGWHIMPEILNYDLIFLAAMIVDVGMCGHSNSARAFYDHWMTSMHHDWHFRACSLAERIIVLRVGCHQFSCTWMPSISDNGIQMGDERCIEIITQRHYILGIMKTRIVFYVLIKCCYYHEAMLVELQWWKWQ